MKRAFAKLILCGLLVPRIVQGQVKESDLKAYLPLVTERGRELYAYDQAAWHGTDAFFTLHPQTDGLAKYVCHKTSTGWAVSFGKLSPERDKLLVIYEAVGTNQPGVFTAKKLDLPREETGFLLYAERALELVYSDFPREDRAYNTAVLPTPDGNLYVYIYPGQTKETVWPLGGDARYTISLDGTKIIEKRQMHKSILDREFPAGTVAGYHTHVLSDVPEETDILLVLTRKPSIPEYVGTQKKIFVIAPDGSIKITKK